MNIFILHPNVKVRSTVQINISAADWGLDTERFSRTIIEKVANSLNSRINLDFNSGRTENEIRDGFISLTNQFEFYGANSKATLSVFDEIMHGVQPAGINKDTKKNINTLPKVLTRYK
jgi:hypothetical protein